MLLNAHKNGTSLLLLITTLMMAIDITKNVGVIFSFNDKSKQKRKVKSHSLMRYNTQTKLPTDNFTHHFMAL